MDNYDETTSFMEYVHEIVSQEYEDNDNKTDMRLISEYIDSPHTPMITQTMDKPDCCIDDVVRIPFDDYHRWLEENSSIPNLEINENGDIVPSDGTENRNGKRVDPYRECPAGMTYAEYFNIRFWNRCCWHRNPYTPLYGYGPVSGCGCDGYYEHHGPIDASKCEAEQLVYPGASPSHEHDGPIDCGCHKKKGSGGGSGGHRGSGGSYRDRCTCFSWNTI